jgi:ATP-dependent DNA helicase RecG
VDLGDLNLTMGHLRAFGSEDAGIEVKRARDKLPSSVSETLSAFANSPGGGLLLLGIEENENFAVTGVADPARMQSDLASAARDQLTPPLQPDIRVMQVEGVAVVVAVVGELSREQKPCFITARGMANGSYLRVGDGDRRLTAEEVQQLIANRGQPRFDHEIVPESAIENLDPLGIAGLLERVSSSNPRIFGNVDKITALKMLNVIKMDNEGTLRLTLAGLLTLGRYPQQFFPQLCLTFVHYPTQPEKFSGVVRFLDNIRIDGPIPVIVREALSVVQRNMSRRALVSASGRQDVWEYPPEALREAIVNALVHRDLSPGSRGTQVQVEMYPDRLRIMNPGGLYGAIDIGRLGEEGVSSSRNALLLKLLEDVTIPGENRTVCENRGSGIRTMQIELSRAGMSPPEFRDKVTSFQVAMPNHTLFDEATVRWLSLLAPDGFKDTQRTALALMLKNEILDNARYRAATGISDSRVATQELQDLVAREFVDQTGTRGGARYRLSEYAKSLAGGSEMRGIKPNRRRQILNLLDLNEELSKTEIAKLLNINPKTAGYWLNRLKREGEIEFSSPGGGTKHAKYQIVTIDT